MYNTVLDLVGLISFPTLMRGTSTSFTLRAHCSQVFNYFRKQAKNLNKNVQSPQQYGIFTSKKTEYYSKCNYTGMVYITISLY
jgi:hypothetical protein